MTTSIMITVITMMHVHDDDVDDPGDGFHPDHVDVHDGDDDDDDDDDDGNHEDGGGTSDPNLEVQAIQIWRYKRPRARFIVTKSYSTDWCRFSSIQSMRLSWVMGGTP